MFAQDWTGKKRQRDEEDGPVTLGFGEHRIVGYHPYAMPKEKMLTYASVEAQNSCSSSPHISKFKSTYRTAISFELYVAAGPADHHARRFRVRGHVQARPGGDDSYWRLASRVYRHTELPRNAIF